MATREKRSDLGSVLVVDDERAVATVLTGLLRQAGYDAHFVDRAAAALERVRSGGVDVVLTDLRMPGMDGMALLEELRASSPGVPVILLTAHGSVTTAVEAMKKGAADFLSKPFDRDEVLYTVGKVLRSAAPAQAAPPDPEPSAAGAVWLGDSEAMREVASLVQKAAGSAATVLLRGESGSGKEVAARAIHAASPRRDGPFVPVHCAALPENLLESELFGYERGAFTGAVQRKPGRVELAAGGTLFLDEIGDISLGVQVKLLRLLQEKEYQRLGGTETLNADVRFLAATHRDLDQLVADGDFREDLFYRLNVIPVWIPPLRERRPDIAPLARRFCADLGRTGPKRQISDKALERLSELTWPGNARELSNFIERLVVFSDGDIDTDDVERELARAPRPRSSSGSTRAPGGETLDEARGEAEQAAIREALERAGGNRTKAARLLGISRRTLYNKLAEAPGAR